MNIPQDAVPDNILSFPQRIVPRESAAGESFDQPGLVGSETASTQDPVDRVLAMSDILEPLPGEQSGVSHLRVLPLGISSGAFFPYTATEDVPAAAQRLGVTEIELMLQTRGEYQPGFAKLLARRLRDTDTRAYSVHSMDRLHRMFVPYERRYREERDLFQRCIELTATVGARVLVWHGAQPMMVDTEEGWERFVELAKELAATCGEAGITLGIENVSSGALHSVRNVARFATRLAEFGSTANIGFVFDPFQAVEADANPFMMLAAMGNRVVNVHISDAKESDKSLRHLPPGDGDLPWSALLRAIAGSGYRGPLMIEGPLGTDDRVMRRIHQTFDPLFRNVFAFPPEGIIESGDWMERPLPPVGVQKGIDLFNARRFYEQHEEIEHEWHAERGPVRRLYQGMLQIGVGFHHALNRNHTGAILLLTQGIEKVSAFTPQALGIDTERLVHESRLALDQLVALGEDGIVDFDEASIPHIVLAHR